ncbi:MAG: hypothetical protein ABI760_05280 [Ferruginibacter sp.]
MYKYTKMIISLLLLITNGTYSQNVGNGTTTPATSATLEIKNTDKGMLIPRVHVVSAVDATIPAPAVSLLVYNTNASLTTGAGYYFNYGTATAPAWEKLVSSADDNIAFAVRYTGIPLNSDLASIVPFNTEEFNVSNNFLLSSTFVNPNTFIAPVKGIYKIESDLAISAVTGDGLYVELLINGANADDDAGLTIIAANYLPFRGYICWNI